MRGNDRDLRVLEHMLTYCGQIEQTMQRFSASEACFSQDIVYQNAIALCLLQIGELVGSLSEEYRAAHREMPWRQIKALRNIIAHHYGVVDAETIWEVIQNDIPELKAYCQRALEEAQA